MKPLTNCPNCGAPIKGYGYCEYCHTRIDYPMQMVVHRPGVRKLTCQKRLPIDLAEMKPEAATAYAMRGIRDDMADALTDSIKFTTSKEFDFKNFEEVILVRGELWVADPSENY